MKPRCEAARPTSRQREGQRTGSGPAAAGPRTTQRHRGAKRDGTRDAILWANSPARSAFQPARSPRGNGQLTARTTHRAAQPPQPRREGQPTPRRQPAGCPKERSDAGTRRAGPATDPGAQRPGPRAARRAAPTDSQAPQRPRGQREEDDQRDGREGERTGKIYGLGEGAKRLSPSKYDGHRSGAGRTHRVSQADRATARRPIRGRGASQRSRQAGWRLSPDRRDGLGSRP